MTDIIKAIAAAYRAGMAKYHHVRYMQKRRAHLPEVF